MNLFFKNLFMFDLQVNMDRKDEPEREFQPTLQCSSARLPVRGWLLGWRRKGSPEKNKSNISIHRMVNNLRL